MSEFRRDPISGAQVIIAPQRSARPAIFGNGSEENRNPDPAYVKDCPFCVGNEQMTPPEVFALGRRSDAASDTTGWKVRMVPNRYPAVEFSAGRQRPEANTPSPGYGTHEVLIEFPEHNRHPGGFPPGQMELVLEACYRRGQKLAECPDLCYLQLYRNYRREAGASVGHPHSQLLALPFVPIKICRELERSQSLYQTGGVCPFCRLIEEESRFARRTVLESGSYIAFIPYAARSSFETWILPRRHRASFLETSAVERAGLADILEELLRKMSHALGDPPYNCYLHTAPLHSPPLPHYHWHLELHPRIGIIAGFEMGSGVFINETAPEEAARIIREKGNQL